MTSQCVRQFILRLFTLPRVAYDTQKVDHMICQCKKRFKIETALKKNSSKDFGNKLISEATTRYMLTFMKKKSHLMSQAPIS